jgi:hypothetical protein
MPGREIALVRAAVFGDFTLKQPPVFREKPVIEWHGRLRQR